MDSLLDGVQELFGYNRENFFFDRHLRQEREYQEQDMRVKQFILYREDVRDLTELTTAKMDSYLVIVLLELGCCIDLLVRGVLKGAVKSEEEDYLPEWLLWLYVISIAQAFLYLFLSAWFAIHASVSAHSFTVRLLTQYVRLPVPNKGQLDAARAYAADFEGSRVEELIRVPVLRQQAELLAAGAAEETSEAAASRNPPPSTPTPSQFSFAPTTFDRGVGSPLTAATAVAGAPAAGAADLAAVAPVAAQQHMKLYRQLQANWQSHDAYARACMSLGTYTLLQAISYYCIGLFQVELEAPMAAVAGVILLPVLAWHLMSLDLYFSRYSLLLGALGLMSSPLLALIAVQVKNGHLHKLLLLMIFLLQAIKIVTTSRTARGDGTAKLPTLFRSVLYLDVFSWLDRLADSAAAGLGDLSGGGPDSSGRPVDVDGRDADADGARETRQLPASAREALARQCRMLGSHLLLELRVWRAEASAEAMRGDPRLQLTVEGMYRDFVPLATQLVELLRQNGLEGEGSGTWEQVLQLEQREREKLWLRREFEAGDATTVYFIQASTQRRVQLSPGADALISDIGSMRFRLNSLAERVGTLRGRGDRRPRLSRLRRSFSRLRPSADSQALMVSQASYPSTLGSSQLSWSPSLAASLPPGHVEAARESTLGLSFNSVLGAPSGERLERPQRAERGERGAEVPSRAQEMRFGGQEAAELNALPSNWLQTGLAAQTFYPRRDGREESLRPPGEVPWTTFNAASYALVSVWLCGICYVIRGNWGIVSLNADNDTGTEVRAHLTDPELLLAEGDWPHSLSSPRLEGLACHSDYDSRVLLLDRYGVHEVALPGAPGRNASALSTWGSSFGGNPAHLSLLQSQVSTPKRLRAADACLAQAAEFHAAGLTGLSLDCTAGVCSLLLLNVHGDRALLCSLHEPDDGRYMGSAAATTVLLPGASEGRRWAALMAPGDGPRARRWWGLEADASKPGNQQLQVLRLRPSSHARDSSSSKALAVRAGKVHAPPRQAPRAWGAALRQGSQRNPRPGGHSLHALGAGRLLGLAADASTLRVWRASQDPVTQGGEEPVSGTELEFEGAWQLPSGVRWTAVCAAGEHLYAAGIPGDATGTAVSGSSRRAATELWRFRLPEAMVG